jgi:predicted membrane protein (TIGR00267 family)
MRWLKILKEYDSIARFSEIARRYFVMNSFDGILTVLGVVFGTVFGGIKDTRIVVVAGVGVSVAMLVSGAWGAYIAEQAERRKTLLELERATLSKLKNTRIAKASLIATLFVSFINGITAALAGIIILLPFILGFGMMTSFYISAALAFSFLFMVGVFLGRISKQNILISGLKMILAGLASALISYILL